MIRKKVRARLDTHLVIWLDGLPRVVVDDLKDAFTRGNPEYHKKRYIGISIRDIPRQLFSWDIQGRLMLLPRGAMPTVRKILEQHHTCLDPILDRTTTGSPPGLRIEPGNEPFAYQSRAVRALVNEGSGILRGGCASGKTIVLLCTLVEFNLPAIIVVHTRALQDQWIGMISKWLGIVPGRIGGGKKARIRPITVASQKALWQMIERGETEWARGFGVLVADEVQHWAARTFKVVTEAFASRHRIGASANERRKDGRQFLIYETFGPVVHEIKEKELIAIGRKVQTRMEVIPTEFFDPLYIDAVTSGGVGDWVGMINSVVVDTARNELIWDHLIGTLEGNPDARVLMLNERVAPCRKWVARIRKAGYSAGLLIGGPDHKREVSETIQGLRDGSVRVGVGTTVADEGLDMEPLTHVYMTCPLHTDPKRMNQMIGRIARTYEGKNEAVCVYFWDREMFPVPEIEEQDYQLSARRKKFLRKLGRVVDRMSVMDQTELFSNLVSR